MAASPCGQTVRNGPPLTSGDAKLDNDFGTFNVTPQSKQRLAELSIDIRKRIMENMVKRKPTYPGSYLRTSLRPCLEWH